MPSSDRRQHLTRRFGAFVAVDELSFDVRRGEIFGFLGSNGAGKSTTIRMLCGLLRPTSRRPRSVGGIDVASDPEGVKQRIGYMSQKFSLYELLTVDQNIRFFGGIYGLDARAARRAPPAFVIEMAGLAGREDDARARSRRRLAAAARARLRDPPRARDPVPRRADRRRRPAVAPAVLAADRHAVAAGRDRAGHDALPRRGGALPSRRADSRRPAGRARARRAEVKGIFKGRPIVEIRADKPVDAMRILDRTAGRREDQPVRHRGARRAAGRRMSASTICARESSRQAGVTVEAIEPVLPSLEDVFLDVVDRAGGAAA